ncbi:hypothetical protein CHS0354_011992 [Potamilus streckersoni]|uniref:Uncharacterized protein n=1 Tax=Potamilus streckersoni TaxID=2493646 RepID=A0AAE0SB58_9BIVA|nr:hypothetical protein CHS0354_011992 [Potamilus streckersoni]
MIKPERGTFNNLGMSRIHFLINSRQYLEREQRRCRCPKLLSGVYDACEIYAEILRRGHEYADFALVSHLLLRRLQKFCTTKKPFRRHRNPMGCRFRRRLHPVRDGDLRSIYDAGRTQLKTEHRCIDNRAHENSSKRRRHHGQVIALAIVPFETKMEPKLFAFVLAPLGMSAAKGGAIT